MRITPIEIRQKTFERNFRGYEKDEVNAFLLTLSTEWERMVDENKELRIKLEATEREVNKLREVESSLYKTLKTAEDTGANVIEQARIAAELHLRESQLKADAIVNEAKTKARNTIEESEERAREIVDEMEDRLQMLVENYKKLETSREDLLINLRRLANDALDRVERAKLISQDFNPDQHVAMAKRETKRAAFPNLDFERTPIRLEPIPELTFQPEPEPEPIPVPVYVEEVAPAPMAMPTRRVQKSFFDEIG